MEPVSAIVVIAVLVIGVLIMLWHLNRRANKNEVKSSGGSNYAKVSGTDNVIIQNSTYTPSYTKGIDRGTNVQPVNLGKAIEGRVRATGKDNLQKTRKVEPPKALQDRGIDTTATVIWPTETTPYSDPIKPVEDHPVKFGGGSFGGGGSGGSYDEPDRSTSHSSHSHSNNDHSTYNDNSSHSSHSHTSHDYGSSHSSSDYSSHSSSGWGSDSSSYDSGSSYDSSSSSGGDW